MWRTPHVLYYGVITAFLSGKKKMTQDLRGSCAACVLTECADYGRFLTVSKRTESAEESLIEKDGQIGRGAFPGITSCLRTLESETHQLHTHTLPSRLIAAWAVTFDIRDRRIFTLRCANAQVFMPPGETHMHEISPKYLQGGS